MIGHNLNTSKLKGIFLVLSQYVSALLIPCVCQEGIYLILEKRMLHNDKVAHCMKNLPL